MEGTKNERTVVIITSYIIGFVTGFILLNDYSEIKNSGTVIYSDQQVITQNPEPVSQNITNNSQPDYLQKAHALVSQDGNFIFYCEKINPTDDFCQSYIYEKNTNTAHEVLISNSPMTLKEDTVALVGWSDNILTIGTIKSAHLTEPWLLVDTSTPIDLE